VLFLDYAVDGEDHTLQCRYDIPNTPEDAMVAVDDFLTALGNSHHVHTVLGARFRNAGSTVSTDIAWTGAATYGSGVGQHGDSASYYDFIGRSAGGRRVRVSVFGAITEKVDGLYRAPLASDSAFGAAQAVLAAAEGTFLAIDGAPAIWKTYVNLGDNAYWRNRIR
jgi:hypothetical protein